MAALRLEKKRLRKAHEKTLIVRRKDDADYHQVLKKPFLRAETYRTEGVFCAEKAIENYLGILRSEEVCRFC